MANWLASLYRKIAEGKSDDLPFVFLWYPYISQPKVAWTKERKADHVDR